MVTCAVLRSLSAQPFAPLPQRRDTAPSPCRTPAKARSRWCVAHAVWLLRAVARALRRVHALETLWRWDATLTPRNRWQVCRVSAVTAGLVYGAVKSTYLQTFKVRTLRLAHVLLLRRASVQF